MKRLGLTLAVCLAALGACEGRNPKPALEPVETEPDLTIEETALPEISPPPQVYGLEIFEDPINISILDAGPQDELTGLAPPKFELHCNTATKTLEAVAPERQLGADAVAGPAHLIFSGVAFEGEARVVEDESGAISLTLPLTPELLAAVATTVTARLAIGDSFAESNADTNGAFPGFAGKCSLESGVPLPPR